jgi:hypothetical protein
MQKANLRRLSVPNSIERDSIALAQGIHQRMIFRGPLNALKVFSGLSSEVLMRRSVVGILEGRLRLGLQ